MKKAQQTRYKSLYRKHINALKRQGKADSTIDLYARAVRRIGEYFDCPPDILNREQLEGYFDALVQTYSWSTIKVERNGLQFFFKHTLKRELRYQAFILVCFSMGLRLGETLALQVGDIDGERMKVHIRRGKGKKDRYVTLPQLALQTLRRYWATHRHPTLIFPNGRNRDERRLADKPMDRGGLQKSFKHIVQDVGIHKQITIHTLRHCYGTLLTDVGVSLRAIQQEMGHECPKTTALYTQLSTHTQLDTDKRINGLLTRLRVLWGE